MEKERVEEDEEEQKKEYWEELKSELSLSDESLSEYEEAREKARFEVDNEYLDNEENDFGQYDFDLKNKTKEILQKKINRQQKRGHLAMVVRVRPVYLFSLVLVVAMACFEFFGPGFVFVDKKLSDLVLQFLAKPELEKLTEIAVADGKKKQEKATEAKKIAEAAVKAERQRKFGLSTIGQGEGVINAYTRQLIDDPELATGLIVKIANKEYDLTYKGGQSDKAALKEWADHTACLIAIVSGHLEYKKNRKHREIRIKKASEKAFLIVVNSDEKRKRMAVDVYEKKFSSGDYPEDYYRIFQTDVNEQIVFLADRQNGVGPDVYVWPPAKNKKQKK